MTHLSRVVRLVDMVKEDLEEAIRHIDQISKDNRTEDMDKKLNEAADCIYMAQKFLDSIEVVDYAETRHTGEGIKIRQKRPRIIKQ